jgi:fumarylacetoacetase
VSAGKADETLDPAVRSFVPAANTTGADFPLQNLPFGVFCAAGDDRRIGVAIGDRVIDLRGAVETGVLALPAPVAEACGERGLNALMALGPSARMAVRRAVHALLREGSPLAGDAAMQARLLFAQSDVAMVMPATVGDYTDFYASINHATTVGAMFRPDNPLLPNYKWVPIGYHGRASSVVPSETPVRRPSGQAKPPEEAGPLVIPTRQLDYELELGAWVGTGNALGEPIAIEDAESHLFGVSLLNDWSARDVQAWEYQPLGPFLAKNFATSISPWIVTMDALSPFRVPRPERPAGDPDPLPYLDGATDRAFGAIAITLEVSLATAAMRADGMTPVRLCRTGFAGMYWTLAQMLTHHASGGCNLRPGDLLGSGTVSGTGADERGCLLELTQRGAHPVRLPTGEARAFLEDGDEVVMSGWCERPGAARIGLGMCRGVVTPANTR